MKQYLISIICIVGLSASCGGGQSSPEAPAAEMADADTPETEHPATADAPPEPAQAEPEAPAPTPDAAPGAPRSEAAPKAPPADTKPASSSASQTDKPVVKEAIEARITDKHIVISGKVLFETGNAKLKKVSYEVLDEVVFALEKHPEIIKLQVVGHTDSDGDAKANTRLSKRRATTVMNYLIRKGIEKDRVSAVGLGEDQPIASNDTEEGKDKNRRVEFVIVERANVKAVHHTTSTVAPGKVNSRKATDDETEELIKQEGLDKKF